MKNVLYGILAAILLAVCVRELFPKTITVDHTIPVIVKHTDTVHVIPQWVKDSLVVWRNHKVLSDTVNLISTVTIIEPPKPDTNPPPPLWAVLTVSLDTNINHLVVHTYNLKTREMALSTVYVRGPLLFIGADTLPTPRFDFTEYKSYTVSLKDKLHYAAVGGGIVLSVVGIASLIFRH